MNENTYKYWFFYIKPEYIHLVCTEEKDSLLYAYTDNKEYAKIFKNQRDMDKFFMMKKEIDREEVNYLAKYFMREYLIKKEVKTKTGGIGSKVVNFELIITKTEDIIIQSSSSRVLLVDIWKCAWLNPYIFTEKYLNALTEIGLKDRFDILNSWKTSNKEINKIGENVQPDLLSTFIKEFGFLLSLKKGNK